MEKENYSRRLRFDRKKKYMEKGAEQLTAFQNFSRESYNICLKCYIYFQFTKPKDVLKNNKI